jgi:hypothetical protein
MFDWDDANIRHIAAHGVEPEEAEEALTDPRRVPGTAYNVPGGDGRSLGRPLMAGFSSWYPREVVNVFG